jgi:hypothetical protein
VQLSLTPAASCVAAEADPKPCVYFPDCSHYVPEGEQMGNKSHTLWTFEKRVYIALIPDRGTNVTLGSLDSKGMLLGTLIPDVLSCLAVSMPHHWVVASHREMEPALHGMLLSSFTRRQCRRHARDRRC